MRTGAGFDLAAKLLKGVEGNLSTAHRRSLADSLAQIAITYEGGEDIEAARSAGLAVTALGLASVGAGVPYPGVLNTLELIYEEARTPRMRGAALRQMARVPNRGRVIRFLAGVAVSDEGTVPDNLAYVAVELLARELGPSGLQELRRLVEEGAVKERQAAENLQVIARRQGWG